MYRTSMEHWLKKLNAKLVVRLLRENMRQQIFNYGVAMGAMVLIAATTALTAWIMRDIIDAMMLSGNRAKVFGVAGAVALIFAIKGLATYVQVVSLSRAGNSIVAALQRRVYERILKHGVAFFSDGSSSDLIMRVTQAAAMGRAVIDTIVMGFVRDLLTLIGLVIVMIYQQPTLALFSLIFGPVAIFGIRKLLAKVQEIMAAEMASLAEIIKVMQETSTGIRVIKAFSLEAHMKSRMQGAVAAVESRANSIARLEAATSPLMETLSGFAIAAVVALSVVNLFGEEASSPGQLMSFVTALLMAYEPAKRLARMRVSIEAGMIGVKMMYEIFDKPLSLSEADDARPLPAGPGRIALEDVSFQYADGQQILSGLNVDFEAGTTVALVGPSGGGKSTIMNLMMRLYDPTTGVVKIDGQDLRKVTFESLRDRMAFIGQDTFLFADTIERNIALGRSEVTRDEIVAAAKAAHAHDFIMAQAQGYDTYLGDNGAGLSGGQRQRIAIARAILRDSPILLMDEATSALDSGSEFQIKEALQELTRGRTTVVIAHRLSTVLNADKIVVIDGGLVVETGTVESLLADPKGMFSKLYNHQFAENV